MMKKIAILTSLTICLAFIAFAPAFGKDRTIFNAWDLFYSGSGITSSYNGLKVKDGTIPCVVGDDKGRSHYFLGNVTLAGRTITGIVKPEVKMAKGNFIAVDARILQVSLENTPYVKVGYVCRNDLLFGVETPNSSSFISVGNSTSGKIRQATISIKNAKSLDSSDPSVMLVFMSGAKNADIGLAYIGFFKTMEEANAYDYKDNIGQLKTDDHKRIEFSKVTAGIVKQYDSEAERQIEKIKNLPDIDPATIKGRCWYVSSVNGKDGNTGLSPDSPFKSLRDLYVWNQDGSKTSKVNEGDGVFFERGSVFYAVFKTNYSGNYAACAESGVTYSAYGKGPKPIFTTALDLDGSMDWIATSQKNVWMLDKQFSYDSLSPTYYDVGNIEFMKKGRFGWGVKILCEKPDYVFMPGQKTTDVGITTNGFECFDSPARSCETLAVLQNNLEFIQDYRRGRLYLYFDKGNPGKYFDKIIVALRGHGWSSTIKNEQNVALNQGIELIQQTVLHNLHVTNAGSHGFALATKTTVSGCDIEWIGGAVQGNDGISPTRFGNGAERFMNCTKIIYADNYFNQCYDAGATVQGGDYMSDVSFTGNVLDRCTMSFEFFGGRDKIDNAIRDINISNNYIRYAGYGMGGTTPSHERKGALVVCWSHQNKWKNVAFENNVCLFPAYTCYYDQDIGLTTRATGMLVRNNIYIANAAHCFFIRSRMNMLTRWHENTFYPYSQQYLQYLNDIGADSGSKYYWYAHFLKQYPEEASGAYRFPGETVSM